MAKVSSTEMPTHRLINDPKDWIYVSTVTVATNA
jgi:hypothetical protein